MLESEGSVEDIDEENICNFEMLFWFYFGLVFYGLCML